MKKLQLLLALLICTTSALNAQNVNIPDANFKAYLVADAAINTNGDGEIQVSEAQAFTGFLYLAGANISSLVGIEAFTALTGLDCYYNQITHVDVSNNIALTWLSCRENQLTTLDISANTALTLLWCSENLLTTLDISTNIALTHLYCGNNQLNTLDVSNNIALTNLFCNGNQLTTLDLSTNTALTTLRFEMNQLTTIDLSTNTALTDLWCYNNQLTTLDLSANTALTKLQCWNNQLTTLNLSANIALWKVHSENNQLTTLNVKNGNNSNMSGPNFKVTNNPNLLCIEVDDEAYSYINWSHWSNRDTTASYRTDCTNFNSISTLSNETTNITTYPNPTNGNLTINLEKTYQTATIQVRNTMGQTVFSNTYNGVNQIDLDIEGVAGVYFVSIRTEEGEVAMKVVKN